MEDKFQELPTVAAPIQPGLYPITMIINQIQIQIQIHLKLKLKLKVRERETLLREEAEEGGGLHGE